MADVTLGSKGLLGADLVLVQSKSHSSVLVHEDESGQAVDHEGWSARCRVKGGDVDVALDGCVSFGEGGEIWLSIPASVTAALPLGSYDWDLMCEDPAGFVERVCWGKARVYDSYSYDARDGA